MTQVSFTVSAETRASIDEVINRLLSLTSTLEEPFTSEDALQFRMSLVACEANGCRMRWKDLLAADNFNFAHDVFGIHNNICTKTGKLKNHFSPRFSARNDVINAG